VDYAALREAILEDEQLAEHLAAGNLSPIVDAFNATSEAIRVPRTVTRAQLAGQLFQLGHGDDVLDAGAQDPKRLVRWSLEHLSEFDFNEPDLQALLELSFPDEYDALVLWGSRDGSIAERDFDRLITADDVRRAMELG
jgi:hypothetical protein